MTLRRDKLLNGLQNSGIRCKPASDSEIAIICPLCDPIHKNNKNTLYVNADSGSYICFRCKHIASRGGEDHNKRIKSLGKLLDLLGLSTSKESLLGGDIPTGSLSDIRQKIASIGDREIMQEIGKPIELPVGFRTDWKASGIGSIVYRYLKSRGLSKEIIHRYQIGFVARGDLCGSAIFPVYMNKELRFWQARHIVFPKGEKYFGCPGVKSHSMLYRYDQIITKKIILVEGTFDALAVNGVALFGKVLSDTQVALLSKKRIKYVDILLDGEASDDAEKIALKLTSKLWTARRVRVLYLPLEKDPSNYRGELDSLPSRIIT